MPIKDKSVYPSDWKQISARIRWIRAGGKCEVCGVENYARIQRRKDDLTVYREFVAQTCAVDDSEWRKPITVILTVAHYPDPNPMNCAEDNLLALCQCCHLRLDAKMHAEHAKVTRLKKKG